MIARPTQPRGFTLIEILMVVIILGIASAVIIPQIGSRDDLKVAAATRVIMSDLMYAQNRAITLQKKHYIRFTGQQYSVCDSTALLAIDHPLLPPQSNGKYVITFGAGGTTGLSDIAMGTFTFGGKSILGFNDLGEPFAFDGTTETALTSNGTIAVTAGNETLTVTVEPLTGDTSVN